MKNKAYEADHSDPADRDIACHHRIYYLFAVSGSQLFWMSLFLIVFLSDRFYGQCHFCINGVKIRTSTDVSFSVLIFILLSDSFQIFFDIFLISIFRWFIKRCSKKLIWKILLFLHNDLDNHAHIYIRFHVLVSRRLCNEHLLND